MFIIGVDIGGTFTDSIIINEETGKLTNYKVPSTPQDPSKAIIEHMKAIGADFSNTRFFIHGTTVATNAILEMKGAKVGLITTKGQRDRIEIQRTNVLNLYDFYYHKPKPLIPRHMRKEVNERCLSNGVVILEPEEIEIKKVTKDLIDEGAEVISVCFLNSYANSSNERKVSEIIRKYFSDLKVISSSDILPEILEYERFSTTIISAFLTPIMTAYLTNLEEFLEGERLAGELFIMQGNGGVMSARTARDKAVTTLESGPAAGVIGSAYLARLSGFENCITLDMGGTSTDVCLIKNGTPSITSEYLIDRRPMKIPLIDIYSVGAGGGSIAWIDEGGGLHVGPRSAGAYPGPACYNKGGTEPTVTDAQVILGRLTPDRLLGGTLCIHQSLAQKAVKKIADFYHIDLIETAKGIIKIANSNTANAIKVVSLEKGFDPRDFTLIAYGGAGPMHAGLLARELGIKKILIPFQPGTHCALGLSIADLKHDYVRSLVTATDNMDINLLEKTFQGMEEKGKKLLIEEGALSSDIELKRFLDMRYIGQAYVPVTIPFMENITDKNQLKILTTSFHQRHFELYKHAAEKEPTEIVNARVTAIGRRPKFAIRPISIDINKKPAITYKNVYFEDVNMFLNCPTYIRGELGVGFSIKGPTVIYQMDSTVVIYPDQEGYVDEWGNLIINT